MANLSNTTYLDEFMDKMYLVPNDINRYLRLIRNLDKRRQSVEVSLNQLQSRFLVQMKQYKQSLQNGQKRSSQIPLSLRSQYQKILQKQKQVYGYSKQKHQISIQLKALVNQFYCQLDVQLKSKLKQKSQQQRQALTNRRRLLTNKLLPPALIPNCLPKAQVINQKNMTNGQIVYDLKQPAYCYCGKGSFGEMVLCESPFCQREWFHTQCIEEKNLPEKWYCLDCHKQKEKTRNVLSRTFFVNKEL